MIAFDDAEYSDLCAVLGKDSHGLASKKISLHKAIVLRQSPVLKSMAAGNGVLDLSNESPLLKDSLVPVFKFLYSNKLDVEESLFAAC
jgi:hypothetical protein